MSVAWHNRLAVCARLACSKRGMTFYTHRLPISIRRRERRLRKYLKWVAEVAEENEACRRAHFEAAKEVWIEQGDATFVHCADWARFGDAIGIGALR